MPVMVHDNKERPQNFRPFSPVPECLLLKGPNEVPDAEDLRKQKRLEHLRMTVNHIVEPERFAEYPEMPWGESWADFEDDFPHLSQRAREVVPKVKSWPQKLRDREKYTPDFRTLKMQSQILVFVYGSEKRGKINARLLEGSVALGGAHTVFKHYLMKEILPGVPLILQKPTGKDGLPYPGISAVRGEAYITSVEQVHLLDELHMRGIRSERVWRHIAFETVGMKGDRTFLGRREVSMALMWVADKEMFSPENGKTIEAHEQKFPNNPQIPDGKYSSWFY